jgi:pyruvate,water dikinase
MTEGWVADDSPSTRFPLYTRGNVGEVFPTVVMPLTWTTLGRQAELGWRDAFRDFGTMVEGDMGDEPMVILGVFGGYCYINASYTRIFAVRTPGLKVSDIDQQFFGTSDAPPYVRSPGDRNLGASLRAGLTIWRTLTAGGLPELDEDKAAVEAWLARRPDPATATGEQLADSLNEFGPLFRQLFRHHILTTFRASVGPGLLAQMCERRLHDPSLLVKLLGGIGDVESAAPSAALWELGRQVREDATLTPAFDAGLAALEQRLAATASGTSAESSAGVRRFQDEFAAFLAQFGSRGPNEWETASPTWGTNPGLALAAIDRMRLTDPAHAPTAQQDRLRAERLAATAEARRRLPALQRGMFDRVMRSCQVFSQGRERSKTTVIRAIHGVRLGLRELARRARDRGGPGDLADMWLLTIDELPAYVADPPSFTATLAERRALRDRLEGLVPPFVFEGVQPAIDTWAARDAEVAAVEAGQTLQGIPGCPGVAKGRARVVLDPLDPRGLAPGEVLVAPITDPSWTPLFVPAEAVVVDVGAVLSHAVIVSRELGIPCVVSVTGATRSIPDGALIEVDGSTGVVTVLEV